MTEIALNELIAGLPGNDPAVDRRNGKARRAARRAATVRKTDARLRIIQLGGYAPHRGYVHYDGATLLHSGQHIRYLKSSRSKVWLKRETSRAARRACGDIPVKGNYYRRLLDLWWTLT